jgi:transposase
MKPYSNDLRGRAAAAVDDHEGSLRQIARRFRIGLSTLTRWLRSRRQNGSLEPKPHGGGQPPAVDATHAEALRDLVRRQPDATLDELNRGLRLGCSRMAIFRALRRLRISRKKKVLHARERDTPRMKRRRRDFRRRVAGVDAEHLVFVDETGATTAMTRTYGRAPIGERVAGVVPGGWKSVTLVAGLRLSGVVSPMAFAAAMDTPDFEAYVEQVLVPGLRPGDVVIWDNLKAHRSREARRYVARAGARVVRLPPYSPDLTPIEKMYSKVKDVLRSVGARTVSTVYEAMDTALKSVKRLDILGWFQSCGLCPTQA